MIDIKTRELSVNLYKTLGHDGIIGERRISIILTSFNNEFHINSLYNWKKQLQPKQRKYNNYKITDEIDKFTIDYVTKNPNTTVVNVKKLINTNFKTDLSKSSVNCIFKKNNLTYKKCKINVNKYSIEKQKEQIQKVSDEIKENETKTLISIDEMSIHLNEKPNYGWSEKGKECVCIDKKGNSKNERLSLLMAVSKDKVIDTFITKGSINSAMFLEFLAKIKDENRVFFLDNCKIHHAKIVKEYVNEEQMKLIYNAPYHSELNPIEYVFSIMRKNIQNNENHTVEKVTEIVNNFSNSHNTTKFTNIFNHCLNKIHNYE